jgi:hypothetical protein
MNTEEVASKLVALCREQKWLEAIHSLYADDIVSVEAQDIGEMPAEMRGLDQVRGKTQWFMDNHEIHESKVTGPFVAGDKFVVQFDVDVTDKASGKAGEAVGGWDLHGQRRESFSRGISASRWRESTDSWLRRPRTWPFFHTAHAS